MTQIEVNKATAASILRRCRGFSCGVSGFHKENVCETRACFGVAENVAAWQNPVCHQCLRCQAETHSHAAYAEIWQPLYVSYVLDW